MSRSLGGVFWRFCMACYRIHPHDAFCLSPTERRLAAEFSCYWGWNNFRRVPYLVLGVDDGALRYAAQEMRRPDFAA